MADVYMSLLYATQMSKDWRYMAATDLTWRAQDIIQAYGLRWLVETFNEDWKQYGG